MNEVDVDMAIHAIGQAVADLLAAARDAEARGYVEVHRERLIEDIDRLSESLAAMRDTAGMLASRTGNGNIGSKRVRSSNGFHHRRPVAEVRAGSRSQVG